MNRSLVTARVALVAVYLLAVAGVAGGGSITGVVRDQWAPPPGQALNDARVSVYPAKENPTGRKPTGTAQTKGPGAYRIDVDDGDYILDVQLDEYIRISAEEIRFNLKGSHEVPVILMMRQRKGSGKYYSDAADDLAGRAKDADKLAREWDRLAPRLAPSARVNMAKRLNETVPPAMLKGIPDVVRYGKLDPKMVSDIEEESLARVRTGKSFSVADAVRQFDDPKVVAEIFDYSLTARGSADERKEDAEIDFLRQGLKQGEGTGAVRLFLDLKERGLLEHRRGMFRPDR